MAQDYEIEDAPTPSLSSSFRNPTSSALSRVSQDLNYFFGSPPEHLHADARYHTKSKGTRKPQQFDRHLYSKYQLKRVVKLSNIPQDLICVVNDALASYPDIPPPMKDRSRQTLFVSEAFALNSPEHPYRKLHTGLYIAAIRDAEDRATSISRGRIPETWTMCSGVNEAKLFDYQQIKDKKVVVETLLDHAETRLWLKIVPESSNITSRPFTSMLYQRMNELPSKYHEWYKIQRKLYNSEPHSEQFANCDGDASTQSSVDISQWSVKSRPSSASSHTSTSSNVFTDTNPDTNTVVHVYTPAPFHKQVICR
ncbi:hypothetical protein H0H92_003148 [Tricholoma furcatifolium]|nr:hypothetical protein H0H92_003148 [Tricholoma furcatifolium]